MNKCIFYGRLCKDVEVKTAGETQIANFTLAVNRKFKKDGQPDADFLPMIAFGKTGENLAKYFEKGSPILVTTRVQTRNWEDADGKKHYTTEFVVDEFDFVGGKSNTIGGTKSESPKDEDEEFEL